MESTDTNIIKNEKILNLPNQLTLFRVILVPVFILIIYFDTSFTNKIATIIFSIASITDFIDGYIARKYKLVTSFGKILDPIADKILVAAALVVLVDLGRLSAIVVIILLAREFAVGALRDFASSKGVLIPAGWSGKVKTTFQMVAIGFLIYKDNLMNIPVTTIGNILIYSSVIISVYSGIIYYKDYFTKNNK
jgi:CDP-diacylglycerol--glycerol-3-phosphate 3-phosphatidyltransferase/cardiolipin synthase